ncbi:MAG TPA: hypothetical protein VJB95_02795 [Candidatus Paceibacterota bacterium]
MKMTMGARAQMGLEYDWDRALGAPFALAPADLVQEGLVDDPSYNEENKKLGEFCAAVMQEELAALAASRAPRGKRIGIMGAGLMRDTRFWIPRAVSLGLQVKIRDISRVACKNARQFIAENNLGKGVTVSRGDVEDWRVWEDVEDARTLAFYAGQFFQNQTKNIMWDMMYRVGSQFLKIPHRCVYILHPRGEDNPPEKVRWRNTVPYTDAELFDAFGHGFCEGVQVLPLGKHLYFHQTYTLFKVRAA